MDGVSVYLGTFLFLVVVFILPSIVVLTKTNEVKIIETFGKYSSTKGAGISFKWPSPFQKVSKRVPLYVQGLSTELELKTKDNLFIKYPVTIQCRVIDPVKATYELENPEHQILSYIRNLVRSQASGKTFIELYEAKDELKDETHKVLAIKLSSYGFEIVDVLVDQPIPTQEVQEAYNNVTSSARQKEAAENIAEAKRISIVQEAVAHKEAKKLQGEGIAAQREAMAKGLESSARELSDKLGISSTDSMFMLLEFNKLDTHRDMSNNQGTVIVTDGSTNSMMSSILASRETKNALNKIKTEE